MYKIDATNTYLLIGNVQQNRNLHGEFFYSEKHFLTVKNFLTHLRL